MLYNLELAYKLIYGVLVWIDEFLFNLELAYNVESTRFTIEHLIYSLLPILVNMKNHDYIKKERFLIQFLFNHPNYDLSSIVPE